MTGSEIFTLVSKKKQQIEDLLDPTIFTFNPEVEKLQTEIRMLQNKCQHDFKGGVCKYCELEER